MKKTTEEHIEEVCNEICDMLIEKNRSYGDSAVNPVRIFAKGMTVEQMINVRIDDKLSRLVRGEQNVYSSTEDTEKDLMGYLILKRVAGRVAEQEAGKQRHGDYAPRGNPTLDMEIVTGRPSVPDVMNDAVNDEKEQCVAVNDAGQRCELVSGHEGNHANHRAKMIWARRVTT